MTVLQAMEAERLQKREGLRLETRRELHAALGELVAGRKVIVFGSRSSQAGSPRIRTLTWPSGASRSVSASTN